MQRTSLPGLVYTVHLTLPVLTHVYNLFLGGTCIEDFGHLQHSEPIRRLLGTQQIPSLTMVGDFLRRFEVSDIDGLDRVGDAIWQDVWKHSYGRKRQAEFLIDRDSHVHHVYGHQMEGCDPPGVDHRIPLRIRRACTMSLAAASTGPVPMGSPWASHSA